VNGLNTFVLVLPLPPFPFSCFLTQWSPLMSTLCLQIFFSSSFWLLEAGVLFSLCPPDFFSLMSRVVFFSCLGHHCDQPPWYGGHGPYQWGTLLVSLFFFFLQCDVERECPFSPSVCIWCAILSFFITSISLVPLIQELICLFGRGHVFFPFPLICLLVRSVQVPYQSSEFQPASRNAMEAPWTSPLPFFPDVVIVSPVNMNPLFFYV